MLPFLVALFTVGSGASFLETAANPFIAQFGAGGDVGAAAEFCAVVQSSGDDCWGADWGAVYFFGCGAERLRRLRR